MRTSNPKGCPSVGGACLVQLFTRTAWKDEVETERPRAEAFLEVEAITLDLLAWTPGNGERDRDAQQFLAKEEAKNPMIHLGFGGWRELAKESEGGPSQGPVLKHN